MELEGTLLRAELGLQQRGEAMCALETRVQRLDSELQQARLASSRAVKQFEKRTIDGVWHVHESNIQCMRTHIL